jgi:hypothetical protein
LVILLITAQNILQEAQPEKKQEKQFEQAHLAQKNISHAKALYPVSMESLVDVRWSFSLSD